MSRRLTLNLGVRYDLFTHPYEASNQQSNYDIATNTLVVAGQNGASRSLINTNFTNFAPRIGFAYDLYGEGKTALRGGYGIYYFLDRGGVGNQLSNNPDFNGTSDYSSYSGYRINLSGQAPLVANSVQQQQHDAWSLCWKQPHSGNRNVAVRHTDGEPHQPAERRSAFPTRSTAPRR